MRTRNYSNPCQKAKDHLQKNYLTTDRGHKRTFSVNPLVNEYLLTATDDLKAARAAFSVKTYSQAIFLLQQSIEKTTKAYALLNGYLDEKASRLLSHDLPCIFEIIHKSALDDWNAYKAQFIENNKILSLIAGYEDNLKIAMEELESFRLELMRQKDVTKKYFLSMDEINEYIFVLDQIMIDWSGVLSSVKEIIPTFKELTKQYLALLSDPEQIKYLIEQNTKNEKSNIIKNTFDLSTDSERMQIYIDDFTQNFTNLSDLEQEKMLLSAQKVPEIILSGLALDFLNKALLLRLLNLTIPLSRHATLSRYPKEGGEFTPRKFYSEDLPLIILFPSFANHTEITIHYMEIFLQQMDEFHKTGSLKFDGTA